MGDTKQILISSIKEWIVINSNIVSLQKQLKELKDKQKNISGVLIKIMETNEIDRVDINNGKLLYKKTKVKTPINKDYLTKMLDNYFKDNPEVDSNHICEFLLENRPIKENSVLVIKQNK
jgi:septal ring factor EnvC (AmiA/AmiB activator)